MADSRPAQPRAGDSVDEAIRKQVDAARMLKEAGYQPGFFVLKQVPMTDDHMRAAVARSFGNATRLVSPSPSIDAVRHLPWATMDQMPRPSPSVWESTKAGLRGAKSSVPFEAGNYLSALSAAKTAWDWGQSPIEAFHWQLEAERGQDRYDEAVHPTARTIGKVAGTAAQLAVPGTALAKVAGASRMAEAAPVLFKEARNVAAIGAVAGTGMQGLDDALHLRRSSPADYAGSAFGGGVGALTALYGGPGYVGGATGGATSLAQDMFNGRLRSASEARSAIDRAADATAFGNLFSVPIGMHVAAKSHQLPWRNNGDAPNKGALGEWLSMQRTRLRGQRVVGEQVAIPVSGGNTIVDHLSDWGPVEAKFGNSPRLRPRQKQAYRELENYRVDHFMPNDLGAATEVPTGAYFIRNITMVGAPSAIRTGDDP